MKGLVRKLWRSFWVWVSPPPVEKHPTEVLIDAWMDVIDAEPHHYYDQKQLPVMVGNIDAYMLLLEHATVCLANEEYFPNVTLYETPVKLRRFYDKKDGIQHDIPEVRLRFIDRVLHFLKIYHEKELTSPMTSVNSYNLRKLKGVVSNLRNLVSHFS